MDGTDKVALVTGAGSGVGEATALRLASGGVTVGALDMLPERVAATEAAIAAAGGTAIPLIADVSDEGQMRAAVAALMERAGRLDIVIANAGINGMWAPIDDITPAEWDKTIAVNLRGTYLTLHLTVPHLKRQGGAIVIVSSINGTRTFTTAGAGAYTAAKAAQAALSNQMALELARYGIRVNAVCPGTTRTNMSQNTWRRNLEAVRIPVEWPEGQIPLTKGQPASPAEIADAIAFLASDDARHVTGTWLYIDGGQSLLR
ncbi:MAG TPA: SDR family NAD(P)-dependent oxidoreductase [Devosia sp.]|nr:SDR family NAD(P)-dependent oxidoreductase [Devosia sp.]